MNKLFVYIFFISLSIVKGQTLIINCVAGDSVNGYSGDGGPASMAHINVPTDVVFDANNNLYIADRNNGRVRKVDTAGIITTFAGNGILGFAGDGGPATSAKLNNPAGLAFDSAGNLYISDPGNNNIRKVNTSGIISTLAGNGTFGYGGDGGPATAASFQNPYGLAVDHYGNLYIADMGNNLVRKVNIAGTITSVVGVVGMYGYNGDGIPATTATLYQPSGLACDGSGNLYIADASNFLIRKVNGAGLISTVAGNGTAGFSGDSAQATNAQLSNPTDLTVDGVGNLYITDQYNRRIRKISTTGIIITIAGNGAVGLSGDGGPALLAEFISPAGINLNSSGEIYFTDYSNRVRKITCSTGDANCNIVDVGVKEIAEDNTINVYPNPNNGTFTINQIESFHAKIILKLFDVMGKLVLSQVIESSDEVITIRNLNTGIYNLNIINNKKSFTKRIIVLNN